LPSKIEIVALKNARINLVILDCCPKCISTFPNFERKEVHEKENKYEMEIQDRVQGPENGGSIFFRNVTTSLPLYPRKP
jgi:hypothetical protein